LVKQKKADRIVCAGNKRVLLKTRKLLHIEIRIEGCLDPGWAEWFEGLEMNQTVPGETVIMGEVVDQAALYGLMGKLRDLGVKLLAVTFEEKAMQ
jgi:hypothetical protein